MKPFRDLALKPPQTLADLMGAGGDFDAQLRAWRENPFEPHEIARLRLTAYMQAVVMKYLDTLMAWGDRLFQLDTIESINEATQLYVLAAQLLGPRPEQVPARARPGVHTWASLAETRATDRGFLDLLVQISMFVEPNAPSAVPVKKLPLGTMPLFCLTPNEKLLGYWDLVEDRLFKVRHCMNIEGVTRRLPLFDAPIDPMLLVRAAAAGVDLGTVLQELDAPVPHYRFAVMSQKATELAGEVKALGGALLSALEKRDSEALGLLRQRHELDLLRLVRDVRQKQVEEADAQVQALLESRAAACQRYVYYQRLLGRPDARGPERNTAAESGTFLPATLPGGVGSSGTGTEGLSLTRSEADQLTWLEIANNYAFISGASSTVAGILHALPESGPVVQGGGTHLGNVADAVGRLFSTMSGNASYQANRASIVGGFARRRDEWMLQNNLAARDITQIDRQLAAAEIRVAIARHELANHDRQADQAKELDEFMRSKYTREELYGWMVGQVAALHFQAYQLACDVAKRAEKAFRYELGVSDSNYVRFGYWDSIRKGLLAGEHLSHDIKRMEVAYLEQNRREYETSKHISLASLNPSALVQLKMRGVCELTVPEWAFDQDYPGHYMRRIKSVGVTVACVVGPYAGVNCKLTLQSSSIRVSGSSTGTYDDDSRFAKRFSEAPSIITSTAQDDSGMFETNLRDDRYLAFEGHGAISNWRIDLPAETNSFDVNGITDVILHLRYTARDGGDRLAQAAREHLNGVLRPAAGASLFRMFSVRHEFPDDWYRFLSVTGSSLGPLDIGRRRFPLLFARKTITVLKEREYYLLDQNTLAALQRGAGTTVKLQVPTTDSKMAVNEPSQEIILTIDRTKPETLPADLLIVCSYTVSG